MPYRYDVGHSTNRIASRIHFGHPAPNFIPHIGLLHGPILPTNRMPSPAEFHNPSDAAPSTRTTSHRPYPLLLTIATKSAESQVVSKRGVKSAKNRQKPPESYPHLLTTKQNKPKTQDVSKRGGPQQQLHTSRALQPTTSHRQSQHAAIRASRPIHLTHIL